MKKLGNRVVKILSIDQNDYRLKIKYQSGEVIEVSLAEVFANPQGLVAEILKGNLFGRCYVESGAVAWPNGLELCPDALTHYIIKKRKAA